MAVDGGWRIYSSGPGVYARVLLEHAFGIRRHFGERSSRPSLPSSLGSVTLETIVDGRRLRSELSST